MEIEKTVSGKGRVGGNEQKRFFEKFHDHLMSPLGGSCNASAAKQIVDNCRKYLEFINQEKENFTSTSAVLDHMATYM